MREQDPSATIAPPEDSLSANPVKGETGKKNFDFSHLGGIQVKPANETPDTRASVLNDLKNAELHKLTLLDARRLLARLKQQLR